MSDPFYDVFAEAGMVLVEIPAISGSVPTDKQKTWLRGAASMVDACIMADKPFRVHMSGYGADKRELHEIPEARRGVLLFWEEFQPHYSTMSAKKAFTGLLMSNLPMLVLSCLASEGKVDWVRWDEEDKKLIEVDPGWSILTCTAHMIATYHEEGIWDITLNDAELHWEEGVVRHGVEFDLKTKTVIGKKPAPLRKGTGH